MKAEGHKYRKPCVLLADMDDDDYPIFVQFEEIFSISSNMYFKVIPQTTVQYSTHYHAYIITPTLPITYKMMQLHDFFDPGQKAIVLKHAICTL